MKRFLRRWLIKRNLARHAAHLNVIQRERLMLEHTEKYCVRQINDLHVQLLNLDIRARRHA